MVVLADKDVHETKMEIASRVVYYEACLLSIAACLKSNVRLSGLFHPVKVTQDAFVDMGPDLAPDATLLLALRTPVMMKETGNL